MVGSVSVVEPRDRVVDWEPRLPLPSIRREDHTVYH